MVDEAKDLGAAVVDRETERIPRPDLPTLPLRLRQTPGGYKAIEDAEDRLVTFVGMREDDRAWGDFLIDRVNAHELLTYQLSEAARVMLAVAGELSKGSKRAVSDIELLERLHNEARALALVNTPANESAQRPISDRGTDGQAS